MIRTIITDKKELSLPCIPTTYDSSNDIAIDLLDTVTDHPYCSGLAANQIGYNRAVLVAKINGHFVTMINPEYVLQNGGFKSAMESCLSFPDKWVRVRRYKKIRITYLDPINHVHATLDLKGWEARIVQHKMDHLIGKVI